MEKQYVIFYGSHNRIEMESFKDFSLQGVLSQCIQRGIQEQSIVGMKIRNIPTSDCMVCALSI